MIALVGTGTAGASGRLSVAADGRRGELAITGLPKLAPGRVKYSIQYHADQDLDELRRFWGERLGIDGARITMQRKSNSNQLTGRTWRSEHGVLNLIVHDTYLRARMQAWMDCLRASWT